MGVGKRLATIAKSKKRGILTTNFDETATKIVLGMVSSKMAVPTSGGEGVGVVSGNRC